MQCSDAENRIKPDTGVVWIRTGTWTKVVEHSVLQGRRRRRDRTRKRSRDDLNACCIDWPELALDKKKWLVAGEAFRPAVGQNSLIKKRCKFYVLFLSYYIYNFTKLHLKFSSNPSIQEEFWTNTRYEIKKYARKINPIPKLRNFVLLNMNFLPKIMLQQ